MKVYRATCSNHVGFFNVVNAALSTQEAISQGVASLNSSYGCCGVMHSTTSEGTLRFLCYPIDWLPSEFQSEKALQELIDAFNTFAGSLRFLGINEMTDPKVSYLKKNHANSVAYQVFIGNHEWTNDLIHSNKWVSFVIENSHKRTKIENYFSFCLIRCLFSGAYQTIFQDMVEIKKKVKDWFDSFQLAHYGNPVGYQYSKGLVPVMKGHPAVKLVSVSEFKQNLATKPGLNQCFNTRGMVSDMSYDDAHKLFLEGKYDELRKALA